MISFTKTYTILAINFTLLIFANLSFANNKYCPERVHCSADNSLQSCHCMKNDEDSNDWVVVPDERVSPHLSDIMKGDYIFHNAMINKLEGNNTSTTCAYVISPDINSEERVSCVAKSNTILPVFPDAKTPNSVWKTDQDYYYCGTYNYPVSLLQCPIKTSE